MISLSCFHCGRTSRHAEGDLAREVRCPHCRGGMVVPAAIPEERRTEVCFTCGKAFGYLVTRAPRTLPCPSCKSPVRVPGGGERPEDIDE